MENTARSNIFTVNQSVLVTNVVSGYLFRISHPRRTIPGSFNRLQHSRTWNGWLGGNGFDIGTSSDTEILPLLRQPSLPLRCHSLTDSQRKDLAQLAQCVSIALERHHSRIRKYHSNRREVCTTLSRNKHRRLYWCSGMTATL